MTELQEKQLRFQKCLDSINELAKHISPSRSNGRVQEFCDAIPGIFEMHGMTVDDYLSMVNPYKVGR